MEVSKKILTYLSIYGKENKYRLASALKIDAWEVTKALSALEEEGKIEIKTGKIIPLKRKKVGKEGRKKEIEPQPKEAQKEELEEEQVGEVTEKKEEIEEQPAETSTEDEKVSEIAEERIEGTVKFFNPNKGFGFITGDDGKEYYVHKSGLNEGVTIEANNRVSFKVVQGYRGPKAEEVEWISQA